MHKSIRLGSASIAIVSACTLAACSGTGRSNSLPDGAPVSQDVEGRTPVATIELLTKTQAEDPTRYEMARLIVDSWTGAGIPARVLPVGTAQMASMTATAKDYDAYIISYDGLPERLDPTNILARFASINAKPSGSNISMYTNPEFDKAFDNELTASTEEERVMAVHEAQRILREDVPAAPLVYPGVGAAYRSDRWSGIEITSSSLAFGSWNATHATPSAGATELVVGTTINPTSLNPVLATQNQDLRPLQLIFDTVLTYDPQGKLIGNAASTWSVKGNQVHLSMAGNATFSDGHPVTAEDLAFTINYMKEHTAPLFAPVLAIVESVEANGQDATITLKSPSAAFPATALTNLPVLPAHQWSSVADPATVTNENLIGSGPFTLKLFKSGEVAVFDRNDKFRQPAKVASLRLQILGGFDAAAGALESGQIDIINQAESVASQYKQLENKPGVKVVYSESHGWRGIHFNLTREPFNNKEFRKALTDLFPMKDLVDVAHQGLAQPAGSVIAPILKEWNDPSIAPFTYDSKAAMKALERGGFTFGPDNKLYLPKTQ